MGNNSGDIDDKYMVDSNYKSWSKPKRVLIFMLLLVMVDVGRSISSVDTANFRGGFWIYEKWIFCWDYNMPMKNPATIFL
mmetsp:Transcript_28309/g.50146  ORF Transcript_28309/g.50146 Transcript_28309/m.50146 type:complete len:80 (-) Transcript_28309:327-566(-)